MEIVIFPLNNQLEIPVYGSILYHSESSYPIRGWGASLNPEYAIERAVLESLQTFHTDKESSELKWAAQQLSEWEDLQRCVKFDLIKMVNEKYFVFRSFEDTFKKKYSYNNLEDYLEILIEILSKESFSIYFNSAYATNNLHTVHVIIPEAEEFFVVEKGLIIPPKERGQALL